MRVGWYESPFNITDAYGGRSGYAYEYQQKIAAYTGWEYEYVKTSWPKLLEMLQQGEIDLLSDVSHTEERAKHMLYSALPMGEEEYYIFVSNHNRSVSLDNYATFDGKRVGVNKNSVQKDLYLAWAEKYGIKTELVELTGGKGFPAKAEPRQYRFVCGYDYQKRKRRRQGHTDLQDRIYPVLLRGEPESS